jgi:histidinol dehydrogenase
MTQYLKRSTGSAAGSTAAQESITATVKSVISDIRLKGDAAVRTYSEKFDNWSPNSFKLSQSEIEEIIASVPEQTIKDIKEVQGNVRAFAQAQRDSLKDFEIEIRPGVHLGQKNIPINAVGAHVLLDF